MRIVSIGGGPAGLYFAILMKRADPSHEIVVVERNRADDTFGFGVVFSDATLDNFQEADAPSHAAIIRAFAHWDDIDTHYAGHVLRSTGHGFSGMSRQTLLTILQERCAALGVTLRFATEVDDLARYANADLVLAADGLFGRGLAGPRMLTNRSLWRQFPTVRNERWHHGPVVLVGDAAHTAHFSIGSGTKLAMEDVIELARHVRRHRGVPEALAAYEAERRPLVEALQRAAQTSLEWFEGTERYHGRLEPVQFAYSLLTRSLRVTHENLRTRDPKLVAAVERWFAERAAAQTGCAVMAAPPMSTPFRLRDVVLDNRLVVERAGTPGAPGLVLLGSLDEPRGHGARVGLRLAGDFAAGARAATDAGVDLLELDVADKPRATLQAFDAARAAWPMARPIAVRITAGGDADATIELARVLAPRGCDLVSLATGHDPMAGLGAISLSDRIRHEAGIPTLVGAEVDTRPDINSVLAAGRADLCVIRPSRAPSLASAMQQPLWS